MDTKVSALNDYRAIFLIAFIILLIGFIPFGLLDSSFSWAAFVTSGSLFMVAIGMLLNSSQTNLLLTQTLLSSKSKVGTKPESKDSSKSSKKLVRKSAPKKKAKK
jgi:ABC-type transport system involved in cytochrome c biogenesis permease subunit